jgi:hypothetical protein
MAEATLAPHVGAMEVVVEGDALVLVDYPFPGPSRLPARAISEVCVGWAPPALRTIEGEFVFVPAPRVRLLADFATRHGIPFVRREDVWALVLEVFLDTEFGPENDARTLRRLGELGIDREEVERIRGRVRAPMMALTAWTWEWVHYGLFDVLEVMRPFDPEFYRHAMALADRGATTPSSAIELTELFRA